MIKALSSMNADNVDSKDNKSNTPTPTPTKEGAMKEETNEEDISDISAHTPSPSSPAKKIVKKRKPSGFYMKLNMPAAHKEFPAMDSRALRKLLAERYNKLSKEEKEKYFQLAREDALRYEREMKEASQAGPTVPKSKRMRLQE